MKTTAYRRSFRLPLGYLAAFMMHGFPDLTVVWTPGLPWIESNRAARS